MSKIVVVGAGKTGRGFIARLLQEASEEVNFIDKNVELVEALNKEKEFKQNTEFQTLTYQIIYTLPQKKHQNKKQTDYESCKESSYVTLYQKGIQSFDTHLIPL